MAKSERSTAPLGAPRSLSFSKQNAGGTRYTSADVAAGIPRQRTSRPFDSCSTNSNERRFPPRLCGRLRSAMKQARTRSYAWKIQQDASQATVSWDWSENAKRSSFVSCPIISSISSTSIERIPHLARVCSSGESIRRVLSFSSKQFTHS